MPEEKKDKQDRMIELLEEMLKWTKVTSIPHVKRFLSEILQSDEERIAYHYSDGRDSREVAKVAGAHFTTVARWWKTWIRAGIAEPVGAQRGERAKRAFSLEDFGIEVPSLKVVEPPKKEAKAPTPEALEEPERESSEPAVPEASPPASVKAEESM
jgi:transposase-like protein